MTDLPPKVYRMPFLMAIGLGAFGLAAAWSALVLFNLLVGRGTYTINGHGVGPSYFLRFAAVPLLLIGGTAGVIVYAIWREKEWSREVVLFWWFVLAVGMFAFSATANGIGLTALKATGKEIVGFLFSFWYFYRKRTVVQYFRALGSINGPSSPQGAEGPNPSV